MIKKILLTFILFLCYCQQAPIQQCEYCQKIYKGNDIVDFTQIKINPEMITQFVCNKCAYQDTSINTIIEHKCKVCTKTQMLNKKLTVKKIDLFNDNYRKWQYGICPNCEYIRSAGLINDDYRLMYRGGLNLWNDPNTRAKVTGRIDKPNSLVHVLDFKDGHFLVNYKSQTGWISKGVLTGQY